MRFVAFIFCFFISITAFSDSLSYTDSTKQLLSKLDQIVAEKESYHLAHNKQLDSLKIRVSYAHGKEKVNLYQEIFQLYTRYQTDSAQVYLNKLASLSETKTSASLQTYARIGQAEIYAVTGLYAESVEELSNVNLQIVNNTDLDLKLYYYRTLRTLYGWMADYATMPQAKKTYAELTMHYRDTLISIGTAGLESDIVKADKAITMGNPQQAIELLLTHARKMDKENPDPYLCFTLYQAYNALNHENESLYFLVLTTIADLQKATTEYQALPILAQALYERGDIERSYNYLICSMEDANFCKAMLRSIEISKIFPIIDKQYKQIEKQQHRKERSIMLVFAILVIGLIVGVIYLRRQMKKLHISQKKLAESISIQKEINGKLEVTLAQLQTTNTTLRITDKVKEEYIARYLNRCRDYIDTMQDYQRSLNRIYKEHRFEELGKILRSDTMIKTEQEKFYADFDAAFLTLFPDFIEKFNALLQPEARLTPKRTGQLNTELRIFALIRLGISDTQRIAHFLNFSLATVYNYRSKIRNKSISDASTFEKKVEEI